MDTTERFHFHFSLSCIGEGNGNPLQWSCLENPRDGGAWWAAVYGVAQSRTRLKWLSLHGHRDYHTKWSKSEKDKYNLVLEEEMATHSSTLALRIPWTEEPGGVRSLGSQRVGHDWVTHTHTHTHTHTIWYHLYLKNDLNIKWTYLQSRNRHKKQTYGFQGERSGRDQVGIWDQQIHTTV